MQPLTGTLLIARDVGAGWGRGQAEALARSLESRLNQPVVLSFPDDAQTGIADGIESLANAGVRRVVVLPLGLLPPPREGAFPLILARAKRQWPDMNFHAAQPLSWLEWSRWLSITAEDSARHHQASPDHTALLVVGNGSANPMANADVARVAQLVRESSPFADVGHAFIGPTRPTVSDAVLSITRQGLPNVVVVPWIVGESEIAREVDDLVQDCKLIVSQPNLSQPALVNLLVSNHYAALSDQAIEVDSVSGSPSNSKSTPSGLTAEEAFELAELQQRINVMLPSEYQGRFESVSPKSMGTAGLKYDSDGKVAWDEIWTSFCDLALAGGPPHRGTLLEAVTAAEALAEPEQYAAVVAEIERGIRLVTSLPVITSHVPGWVGVRCDSEEMAIWLMRAIIVENIMVRRENDVLYLPAGPQFTVKREIKNVITSIAKTTHYWKNHLKERQARE